MLLRRWTELMGLALTRIDVVRNTLLILKRFCTLAALAKTGLDGTLDDLGFRQV